MAVSLKDKLSSLLLFNAAKDKGSEQSKVFELTRFEWFFKRSQS